MSFTPAVQQSVADKAQTDGAQTFALEPGHRVHQIQFEPSATPSAGTMTFKIRTPGADEYYEIDSIDLTDITDYMVTITAFADSLIATPTSFDAGKTYSLHVFSGD